MTTTYITCSNPVVSESEAFVDFVVSLDAASALEVKVNYGTANDTASASVGNYDFTGMSGTLIFAPGVTTQTVRVAVGNDATAAGLRVFELYLDTPVNAVIAKEYGTALLVDNDTAADSTNKANLSARDLVIDEKTETATFTVLLDKATSDSFSVDYATADGSAVAGSDYTAASGTLTFGAGETAKTVTVAITDDATVELQEMFNLNLGVISGNAAGAVQMADGSGQAMIGRNDQTAVATPTISVSDPVVSEKDGYVDFVISLSAPSTSQVKVNYGTANDTASASVGNYDFTGMSGTLIFAPGVTTQTVRVAVGDNLTVEGLESFKLNLTSPTNAVIAIKNYGVATIVDNDTLADTTSLANLSVSDITVNESAGTATFAVILDKATSDSFSVAYATANGAGATAGSDYVATSGLLTFAPGETAKSVTLNVINDPWLDNNETFKFSLGAITGNAASTVQVSTATATASITNDETKSPTATYKISAPASVVEGNAVTLSLAATGIAEGSQLGYTISGIAADRVKQALNGYVTIDAGGKASIKLNILDNGQTDAATTLKVTLLNTSTTAQVTVNDVSAAPDPSSGTSGNDALAGTAGADEMSGLAGDDTYTVNHKGDIVIEQLDEGADTVFSSLASYTLTDNVENLEINTALASSKGVGNAGDNRLTGNAGANTLNGMAGADTISGGAGGDKLDGGDGNDLLSGGDGADQVIGGGGNDILDGGAGKDKLTGGKGDDTYYINSEVDIKGKAFFDSIVEKAGVLEGENDTVFSTVSYVLAANVETLSLDGADDINGSGNKSNNVIIGNAGNNVISGKEGNDGLTGGAGDDIFKFDTKLTTKVVDSILTFTNVDTINDFKAGGDLDVIYLAKKLVFTKVVADAADTDPLDGLTLSANDFVQGASLDEAKAARTVDAANAHILYDNLAGALYYDADGGGVKEAVQFALLVGAPALTAADFLIV